MSAETFHPAEYICAELEARGWTVGDLVASARGSQIDHLALQLYLCNQKPDVILGDLGSVLARGFGTSEEMWRNLHTAWRSAPDRSQPYDVPEELLA